MNVEDLRFLLSADGERRLTELTNIPITPANHLQIATTLRQSLTPQQAQAVLETAMLRQQAVTKFSRASQMFFTRPALEQASSEIVASYRAGRFARLGAAHIADLGCSIGSDALALAAAARVTGVDWDPLRIAMAQENVRVYDRGPNFSPLQADLLSLTPFAADAVFFDPARRDEHGRRFFSVHDYQPPLGLIDHWRQVTADTAVKISPGVDYAELPQAAEAEFVSLQGEVKECVLWYGRLHSGAARRATLLPAGHTLTTADLPPAPVPVTPPQNYLYEPDGAVIRAHLVQALAQKMDAAQIDADIAYLTTPQWQETPFATGYHIEDVFPFQLKRLRRYLQARQIGSVTIKKRGSALDPDKLQKQLRLSGPAQNHCVVFLTFVQGETAVIIGQKIAAA